MNKYKVCTKCHTILLATSENFHRQKTGKYGLNAKCKKCKTKYYEQNKNKISKQQKERYKANKEEILARQRSIYRRENGLTKVRYDPNEITIYDNYAEVVLCDIKSNEVARTIIDIEDVEKVKGYKWHLNGYGYATTHINKRTVLLSRFIMNYKGNLQVDHIDGNRLDNRKSNLRLVTSQQNNMNKGLLSNNNTGVAGVNFYKRTCKWRTYITIDKKKIHLGYYDTFEEAVKVRKEAEIKYFGEYARK